MKLKLLIAASILLCPGTGFTQTPPDQQTQEQTIIISPLIKGGTLDGQQSVKGVGNNTPNSLSSLLNDYVNTAHYGTVGDGKTDDRAAIAAAVEAAGNNGSPVIFPRTRSGYSLSSMPFHADTLGDFHFNDNRFQREDTPSSETQEADFNSLYTNPWLVVTGEKIEADPAGQPVRNEKSANIGWALECHANHRDPGNDSTSRMIACGYIGMDTGSDKPSNEKTTYSSENLNEVLNLSANSGTSEEIDVNFNGKVADKQWSRGLFITGGGKKEFQTQSVALDIQHSAYDGSLLPWSTGISIREATVALQTYASRDGKGFLYQGYDQNGALVSQIDNEGSLLAAGITLKKGNVTLDTPAGSWQSINLGHDGSKRWEVGMDPDENFYISNRNQDGSSRGYPLHISRDSGVVSFEKSIATGGHICLDSECRRYVYEDDGKIHFGNATNGNVASLDDNGNMTLKGTLIQNGTP